MITYLLAVAAAEGPESTDEVSRIAAGVQALDIGSSGAQRGHDGELADEDAEAGHGDVTGLTGPQQERQHRQQQRAGGGPAAEEDASGSEWTSDDGYEDEEEDEEADEWQVAGKSQNSVRRQRRKVRRVGCRSLARCSSVPCAASHSHERTALTSISRHRHPVYDVCPYSMDEH